MKKIFLFVLLFIICLSLIIGAFDEKDSDDELSEQVLRIHIRANSNSDADQAVKYKVKSAVVDYLVPLLVGVTDKQAAIKVSETHLIDLTQVAERVLDVNGFDYGASATIRTEEFPTRRYDELTLPAGEYTALIIDLGAADGDNWWCVVYPPLCFVGEVTDGKKIVFVSKLKEIIDAFFDKKGE